MGWAPAIMLAIIQGVQEKSLTNFKTSKLIMVVLFHVESEFSCYLNDSEKLHNDVGLHDWRVQRPSEQHKQVTDD